MFEGKQGTANGVQPPRHVLELRVAASDHETELDPMIEAKLSSN